MMIREKMMEDVCGRWGLEHPYTVDFCGMVEGGNYTDSMVLNYYIVLMVMSIEEDD